MFPKVFPPPCAPEPLRPAGRSPRRWILAALLGLAACAAPHQAAEPLDLAAQQAQWQALQPDSPALRESLRARGLETAVWPLPRWDLPALSALALLRQPALAEARARLAALEAESPGRLPRPELALGLEAHSERGEASRSPWSLAIALEALPLGRSGQARRAAEAEAGQAWVEAARFELAHSVWSVHRTLRERHADWRAARAAQALQAERQALAEARHAALAKQLALGALDAPAVQAAERAQAAARAASDQARQAEARARLALGAAAGLTPEALAGLTLDERPPAAPPLDPGRLQAAALLHRLDLRAALARHAAAEARQRAEWARRWPEIQFAPGLAWDQGDRLWTLGLRVIGPPAEGNAPALARARAEREAAAAACLRVQAEALVELARARADLAAAESARAAAESAEAAAAAQRARVEAGLAAGHQDRLALLDAQALDLDARSRRLAADHALDQARAALEDVLQLPLDRLPAVLP